MTPDRILTTNEIARTAFQHIDKERWTSPCGYSHPEKDPNEMCPYCKNEDTDIVIDKTYLSPFSDFYKDKKFRVVSCYCCSAVFSVWDIPDA